ncbi:MAG: hypothetical protein AB1500_09085 [Bacillota bacterium]
MKAKKSALIILVILIAASLSIALVSFAQEDQSKNDVSNSDSLLSSDLQKNEEAANKPPDVTTTAVDASSEKADRPYERTRINDPRRRDIYNFKPEDVEELLEEGYSLQDILKADEIGNRIYEDPKILLQRKKDENKDLEEIEKDIRSERRQSSLKVLKEKYPEEYQKLLDEQFNEEDQFLILAFEDIYGTESFEGLIDGYKQKGRLVFKEKATKMHSGVSKEKMEQYGLSEEETAGLSKATMDQIIRNCEQHNLPVKETLQKIQAAGQSQRSSEQ